MKEKSDQGKDLEGIDKREEKVQKEEEKEKQKEGGGKLSKENIQRGGEIMRNVGRK